MKISSNRVPALLSSGLICGLVCGVAVDLAAAPWTKALEPKALEPKVPQPKAAQRRRIQPTAQRRRPQPRRAQPAAQPRRAQPAAQPVVEYCLVEYDGIDITVYRPGQPTFEQRAYPSPEEKPNFKRTEMVLNRLSQQGWRVVSCAGRLSDFVWTLERRR